ncbi:Alpha-amylase [Symbiodinium microadriaticum]|uniref:alpha-amylase n=1 Tax=Symbiodinium microadriaticum TaxID=2951 RepID=A0A1Q9CHB9_SYMMI|nr:Alpha-amylase [Symbiodinium microadriaticum]
MSEAPRAPMRCAGLLLWLFVQVQGQFEKQRSVVQAPLSAVQRRTASPVDAFGNPVPDSVAIPNIPRAKPPARVTSSAGYLELELVLETVDLQAECEVFRNDADETEPSISCFKGSCVTLVKLASLKVDARYMFTMHSVRKVTDGVTGQVFEFHGPRSHPITFVTAGLPDWQLAIPETTSLGSIVIRLSWEEPNTGGSAILGYQVEMETDSQPGWQMIYDGQQDPSVKHLVLSNLTYGTTYFYNVYAINAIGRSQPISTAYTVAVPLEKTFFYPLSTDPSISRDPIPDFIIADVPTDLTIRAKNPVTEWFEVDSTHRNYLAAMHDACELNSERTLCLPVPEQHPDYQDHRQRLNQVPDCCYATVPNGDGTYSLNYTGNKTGIYSLMVYAIFANGLWGQYWDNAWFYGLPVLSKVDETISFEWGHNEVTALAGDHITARWVGFLLGPTTDEYTIYVKADDSVRVWFQGHLVVDYWDSSIPCCPELWTRQLLEKDRFYSIKVEWKEMQGNAQLRLMWGITGKRKQIIPGANLWRGAPLESAPFRILVHPGPASTQTSGLLEPLEQLRTGASQRLYLQALDTMSNTVNSTDVQFEAYFYSPSYTNATVPLVFRSTPLMLQRREDHIHDHLHFIDLVLLEPGNYTVELFLKGHGQLASSPIHFLAVQDDIQPQMCTVVGPGSREFIAGVETNFTLQLRDAFGNAVPHVDGVTVEVDLEFVEEIEPNLTYDDRRLRNLTGGHYATATSITKGESGSYFITYTGLRAGNNLLTIKVNGLVIMGHEEEVIYNPPVQGQNAPLQVTGFWNERANGLMTVFAPARLPAECTTGVICAVVFHLRDTYGNRMLGDYHDQLQYRTVDTQCNPDILEDPWCVPVDEGHCFQIEGLGEMHACELTPTIGGNYLLRLLVNGQDASYALWAESLGSFSLEDGTAYIRGPTAILVNIGEINATTSTMEGPGRLLEGNTVGVPQPLLVQLKDQYGNNRIVTGSDFQQRRNGIAATLGDRELDTIVYDNGTIEVTVLAIQAGYHNLRVRIGAGCLQVPVRDPCEDISGSPTTLLWWKEAEVSENGMTCQTPYAMEAGRQYHFTCTGRDVFGNINRDHELKLTSFFNYVADPEGFEPPDGWFRGNLSENFNQTVVGSYLASDGRYHFDITLYRAGFYQLIIEMVKVGSEPAIVLASNVLAEGRPAGEATYVLGFPSLPSFMSSVVGGFVTAVANVANEVSVQTRDRFGNAVETASSAEVVAQLRGRSPVQLSLLHLIQGRYRGALVPFAAGPTLLEIRVAGEEIVGSPFDFLVTPGPMVTTNSLVEGFPSELTAGVLSCWNITLRDATENHLLSGQFAGDPTQLEPVTCSDPGSYCFHTQLNGTFTCCINKTSVEEVPANYLIDTFPFTCQIRGDNIFAPENIKLWPHPVSPYWPDSSLKIGSGMLGPYDYPTFIDEQFGWKDWPTNYFRRVQNVDSGQPQHQWNRLRLWYTDGFYNVFKGDDAAILLCDVKGPHSLGVKTLGRPTRPLYRLPYTLDQELGVFEVELKFEKAGYHKVFCSTAARGGMNVEYRDTDGSTFRRVVEGVNISALDQLPVDEQGGSARWDALLYPPTSANYTLILVCRGRDAVLIFNSSLRVTISTTDDTVDQEQLAVIGPLDLHAQTAYSVQVAWTSHSLSSSVQLRWSSDGGIPETILPAEYLYNSKTLLSGYPKTVNVSDVPGPVEAFERVQPFQNGKIRLRWMPPLESNGRPISSYRLRHDDGLGGDFTKEVRVEVSFLTFSEVIPASFTEVEVPVPDSYGNIDSLLDPTKLYRFELRASNDDRADRDFQVDGGGISDQPVVIALQPVEKAGAPLIPVLVESQEHEDGTGFIRIRISPPRETSGGLMVQYRVYASYILDGVFPPLELWAEGSTPLETVDVTLTDLTVGRTYVFEVAYLFSQGESERSPPLELICCYAAIPQAPRNLRRKSDTGGLPVQTDDRITVIWDAPTFAGVRDITHYKVSLTPVVVLQSSEKLRSSEVLRNTRSADDREMQFDSLSAGQTYALRVAAVSGAGDGPWSEEVVMPASGYSTEPRDLHVAWQSNSSIQFAWGEPLRVGAGGLRGYSIYANVSTLAAAPAPYLVGQTVAGQNSFSFTGYSYVATDGRLRNVGLIPGRLYEVFVVAENAAGVGPASVSSTISAVAASKPSAPQAFAVDLEALSQGVVDLSWQMPSTDGDSPIDAYRVQRMKEWPGTFLSQCSVLLNNLGEPGGTCVIGDFAANGVGDTHLIEENPGQVRIYTGRIAVRNVARETQSSVLCSIDVFGDPLFPTAEYDPGRDEPPLRECYVLVEVCADEPGDWHDADSDAFDCGWYAAEPGRCEIFGVRSPGLWNRTASEACCACGGGLKTNELKFCTKEFGTCELNSTIPAFGGLKADYTDGCSAFLFLRQPSVDPLHLTCHDSSRLHVHICKLKLALAPLPAAATDSTWLSMSPMRAWATIPLTLLAAADRGANWPPVAPKNAFVHLFEWSWQDVARECEEWLGPKGFSAVQVSPPMEHIQGQQWWTRYQPVTYNLTSRSGNEKDFRDMVSRCSKVGVSVIADAVINHAAAGNGVGTAGSSYGGRSTAIYSQEDFHHNPDDTSRNCGVSNYNDKFNVQYCDLVGLPDLCTGCSQVQQVVAQYLSNLLQIGVAGFRIDAAKHMDAGELKKMLEQTKGGVPWVFQEVIEGGNEAVTPQMYTDMGKVTEFGYSRQLAPNFINEGKMKYLDTFGEKWGFMSSDSAAVFLDNHDTQRGEASLTYKSGSLYTLANIFMLAHPYGYPKVMSSYYFDDHDQGPPGQPVHGDSGLACGDGQPWVCEHRRPEIANMVAWRQSAGTEGLKAFLASDDGNSIVFCRGTAACVALNRGSSSWKLTAKLTLPPGKYRDVVRASDISTCPIVEVRSDGSADLEVPSMSAVALHIGATEGSHNPFIISI